MFYLFIGIVTDEYICMSVGDPGQLPVSVGVWYGGTGEQSAQTICASLIYCSSPGRQFSLSIMSTRHKVDFKALSALRNCRFEIFIN